MSLTRHRGAEAGMPNIRGQILEAGQNRNGVKKGKRMVPTGRARGSYKPPGDETSAAACTCPRGCSDGCHCVW